MRKAADREYIPLLFWTMRVLRYILMLHCCHNSKCDELLAKNYLAKHFSLTVWERFHRMYSGLKNRCQIQVVLLKIYNAVLLHLEIAFDPISKIIFSFPGQQRPERGNVLDNITNQAILQSVGNFTGIYVWYQI